MCRGASPVGGSRLTTYRVFVRNLPPDVPQAGVGGLALALAVAVAEVPVDGVAGGRALTFSGHDTAKRVREASQDFGKAG